MDHSSSEPETVAKLWTLLNRSLLTRFRARSPGHLLGPCDNQCAQSVYKKKWGVQNGPHCGLPECEETRGSVSARGAAISMALLPDQTS